MEGLLQQLWGSSIGRSRGINGQGMVYSTQNMSVISVNYKSGNQAKQQVTIIDAIDSYLGGLHLACKSHSEFSTGDT
jgi:hypothetical protein